MSESVWIVGAGFSRHAGGPLMYDLFSETADAFLEATTSVSNIDELDQNTVDMKTGRLLDRID